MRKVIPLKKPEKSAVYSRIESSSVHLKQNASGQSSLKLADYLKEEKERVRTMALLMEVAESICRDQEKTDNKT